MQKEMCWLPKLGSSGEKVLHLRLASHEAWRPYHSFPHYVVPDYRVSGGSKGWATYQKLRQAGWTLVSSTPSQTEMEPAQQGSWKKSSVTPP
jgi:hypothetical protein